MPEPRQHEWFVAAPWLGEWLREMWIETLAAARPDRPLRPEDLGRGFEHIARYRVLLGLLAAAGVLPRV